MKNLGCKVILIGRQGKMTLTEAVVFVAPEKHGRHIGIMTLQHRRRCRRPCRRRPGVILLVSNPWLMIGCINFIQTLQKGQAS